MKNLYSLFVVFSDQYMDHLEYSDGLTLVRLLVSRSFSISYFSVSPSCLLGIANRKNERQACRMSYDSYLFETKYHQSQKKNILF